MGIRDIKQIEEIVIDHKHVLGQTQVSGTCLKLMQKTCSLSKFNPSYHNRLFQ